MAAAGPLKGRSGAVASALDARRVHFQHGPIDLVIEAWGAGEAVRESYGRAWRRFDGLLNELVEELGTLRRPLSVTTNAEIVRGAVARRMVLACLPHADRYITPMAAVAGSVADEIIAAMAGIDGIERAYVNNGGDIALHLAAGQSFTAGLVANPDTALRHGHRASVDGRIVIDAARPVRGIATSGWRGRSRSLGIADSVTVLAATSAAADAAATMIANAVDAAHPGIARRRACELDDDSDLGDLLVTVDVGPLPAEVVREALDRGAAHAEALRRRDLVHGAVLVLAGEHRSVGPM